MSRFERTRALSVVSARAPRHPYPSRQATAPPVSPPTRARVFAASDARYVAPSDPAGPSESAHSARADDRAGLLRDRLLDLRVDRALGEDRLHALAADRVDELRHSPAEGAPAVDSDGMTAPTTSIP